MSAHESAEPRSAASRPARLLTWLGGGHWHELGERHERATHSVAGAVVVIGAVLAWLVAGGAVAESTRWPVLAVAPVTLVFALLVGTVIRGTAGGPHRGRAGVAGRAAVAASVGLVVGELAALVLLSAPIGRRLDERALRSAESTPAVALAATSLRESTDARAALDHAVEQARAQQDTALVVARCEYNPTPACPPTRITGVPGAGPETRTANDLLADAQRELDNALAARDQQAPLLDATIARKQRALTEARQDVVADAGRGLGARWVAMNDVTAAGAGALALRVSTDGFFVLICLLPLVLGMWRGETTHDRRAEARTRRERAELDADTAIAIKRAEVRREAEILWAEHQLTQARLAVEAQAEIDREQQRRRVAAAFEDSKRVPSEISLKPAHAFQPAEDDVYLPIAAQAEAASLAIATSAAEAEDSRAETAENLPAPVERPVELARRTPGSIPSIPDATRAAARWVRPLVPPLVARVIDNTTAPLRTARQVFEEVEEITFAFRRTRKVTLDSEHSAPPAPGPAPEAPLPDERSARGAGRHGEVAEHERFSSLPRREFDAMGGRRPAERDGRIELMERGGTRELDAPDGPRQLPPAR
ncbi:DUF4407 domain-containing protein [Mycobacterium parmense]|uniref:Membrane protein n=1 Tax=Mycobacterium parmense TaxID=185642 RepID=A0A7I7YQL0_9MYCO|nr:DUF4407 domain-containing protein [Mycobacterium parmense]MCV7348667.1 DUF4407 domain-containing protein [Mycobacterium parmense]ORW52103.1 hypothetical protein AWC20_21880 [Mycobacterium parmense]BBZ44175.1 membrane protein [Mycobacterium parmense]